jgi:hypothetical protein
MNRIAIDVDECLVQFLYPMAKYHRRVIRKPRFNYVYRQIFDIDEEESRRMVREFYKSEAFLNLRPIRGSQQAMQVLRMRADKMYVVTGRQDVVRDDTETWIETYFPGVFDDVILTNSFTSNEVSKVDICRSLNLGLIIDDQKTTCDKCIKELGIGAFNYVGDPMYEWCEQSDISFKHWSNIQTGTSK